MDISFLQISSFKLSVYQNGHRTRLFLIYLSSLQLCLADHLWRRHGLHSICCKSTTLQFKIPFSIISCIESSIFRERTCTATSTRLLETTNSRSSTSCPALYCYSMVWLVCLCGAMHCDDVGSQAVEIRFRGKCFNKGQRE